MSPEPLSHMQRRDFLKMTGAAAAVSSLGPIASASPAQKTSILLDSENSVASSAPVRWAAQQLQKALLGKGSTCEIVSAASEAAGSATVIVVASADSLIAKGFPRSAAGPTLAESLQIISGHVARTPAILVSAIDARGFNYGLLELAERVKFGPSIDQAFHLDGPIHESPANEVRAIGRFFCCELEDKPWYYDKEFWHGYLDTLTASRFNRFNLGFGLEYDFPKGVTGDYLHFPYPYLVDVPGYSGVRVLQLATADGKRLSEPVPVSDEERARNMEMLRFIAAETGARGLQFQLGIWTHAYQWTDSPNAYHRIEGLTPENHAAYCREALAILLRECPQIQGLTLRVHGESGIPEGSYPFWKTVFEAISGCGRTIEIEMHAKGVNQIMIDMAVATGMPVKLGAKYSAEHQSLGYNQSDIRALEIPRADHQDTGVFSVSGGARLFTRYGYADFLKVGSPYKLLYRLWPGTQRHLLSADPEMAAAYGRTAHFCGTAGIDIMEPMTFKGREGSGNAGGRCAYADESLNPKADWQKFKYFYRVWGRRLYDPQASPEVWRRYLRSEFGLGALPVETSLANASRLLPLVTSSHLTSASNHAFWPEIYDNLCIVEGSVRSPYGDTPNPKCFGTVSPLDPQLFSTIVEHVDDLLAQRANPKYSPVEVAQWLEDYSATSRQSLDQARSQARARQGAEFRRIEEDVLIQIGLGEFFAAKLRSGVVYEIFVRTGDQDAGRQALAQYRKARNVWAGMADRAKKVYKPDVSYGDVPMRRGHWSDRLPDMDTDIAAMQTKVEGPSAANRSGQNAAQAVRAALGKPVRPSVQCVHRPVESFSPGQPLQVLLSVPGSGGSGEVQTVRLYYRRVDQAERWQSSEMNAAGGSYTATIPGEYTRSPFHLEYYFALSHGNAAWMYPGFGSTLSNQPYYTVMQKG